MVLEQYKHVPLIVEVNYQLIPVTIFDVDDTGMDAFNEVYHCVINYPSITRLHETSSGGISISRKNFLPPMYGLKHSTSVVELTVIVKEGMWRFQFRKNFKLNPTTIGGTQATNLFKKKLQELSNIHLEDYWIKDGMSERDTVPKYIIKNDELFCPTTNDIALAPVWRDVHHIDFHSSFAGGLANTYPEFRPTLEYFYKRRKLSQLNKGVLNSLIGNMWSPNYKECGYVRLAKAAISDNNNRVERITEALREAGRIPLLWNTDGVWYHGEIYHGEGEGTEMGQWENDHTHCTFRVKSKGAYEYIENDQYHPVVRGVPDAKKANWTWGSIFDKSAEPNIYAFSEDKGIYKI